jgi:hypothetical protein
MVDVVGTEQDAAWPDAALEPDVSPNALSDELTELDLAKRAGRAPRRDVALDEPGRLGQIERRQTVAPTPTRPTQAHAPAGR